MPAIDTKEKQSVPARPKKSPVKPSRHIHLDCSSGIAGDMFLAALIDLGADIDRIQALLAKAGLSHPAILVSKVRRAGISALHVDVPQPDLDTGRQHLPHADSGSHFHHHDSAGLTEKHHDHSHRNYASIRADIEGMGMPESVIQPALSALRRLAAAESKIHGVPLDEVQFHEVGAVDTIADVLGVCVAMDDLGRPTVTASPVAVGSGTVQAAHGLLPVPAPATVELLRGVPVWSGQDIEAELTTPTGAALLTEFASSYGPMPPMIVEQIGYGAGSRELEDRPNVLRALLGELQAPLESGVTDSVGALPTGVSNRPTGVAPLPSDRLVEIRANIDDMSAELLAALAEDLLTAGALDAWITPIVMKKGRPGHLLSVLCQQDSMTSVSDRILKGSTAFGLRWSVTERIRMPRRSGSVETPWGKVDVMVALDERRPVKATPEFESCKKVAARAKIDTFLVYRTAQALCEDLPSLVSEDSE